MLRIAVVINSVGPDIAYCNLVTGSSMVVAAVDSDRGRAPCSSGIYREIRKARRCPGFARAVGGPLGGLTTPMHLPDAPMCQLGVLAATTGVRGGFI